MEWVSSGGGPLLFLGENLLDAWGGTDYQGELAGNSYRPAERQAITDYDRACEVRNYVDVIPVGQGQGLVLSGEALETTWYPLQGRSGGILVRWIYAPGDEEVEEALRSLPADLSYQDGLDLNVSSSGLVLFDAAMPGRDIVTPLLRITLDTGRYRVLTAEYAPVPEMALLLHRLEAR